MKDYIFKYGGYFLGIISFLDAFNAIFTGMNSTHQYLGFELTAIPYIAIKLVIGTILVVFAYSIRIEKKKT